MIPSSPVFLVTSSDPMIDIRPLFFINSIVNLILSDTFAWAKDVNLSKSKGRSCWGYLLTSFSLIYEKTFFFNNFNNFGDSLIINIYFFGYLLIVIVS